MRISVIIPTYNESGTIGTLLDEVRVALKLMPRHEWIVLVVDGHSTDGTARIVREKAGRDATIRLVEESEKRGIGFAYLTGINHVLHVLHTDAFIEFDGDGQHDPRDISRLVARMEEGYDYVIGSRYVKGGSVPKEWAWHRKLLSRFGSMYARLLLGLPVRDVTSGFRLTRAAGLQDRIPLTPEGLLSWQYAYKIQLLVGMVESGARVAEVPITFRSREHDASKSTWRDIIESLKVTSILWLRKFHVSKTAST
ncbi:MAG: polyprenol monophosphomannose synthase [bacterium]|nr:polyprenol monophosphomannose synthase [bacterium]